MTYRVPDQRILRAAAATLSVQFTDSNGEPVAVTGPVTVRVQRADGTDVKAAGTATSGSGSAPRTVALTAAQTATLDLLTATWTDAATTTSRVTYIEIVGGYYFTVAEARAAQPVLADTSKYPTAMILDRRRQVEEELERICGRQRSGVRSFVPRFRLVTIWGLGTDRLRLPSRDVRTIRSVSFGGVSLSVSALANIVPTADGVMRRYRPYLSSIDESPFGVWGFTFPENTRVDVAYEYGWDSPPRDLKDAAMLRLKTLLTGPTSALPERALGYSDGQGGSYSLATAGRNGFDTGHPDVDAVYHRYAVDDDAGIGSIEFTRGECSA
jgi:hypothetical protein